MARMLVPLAALACCAFAAPAQAAPRHIQEALPLLQPLPLSAQQLQLGVLRAGVLARASYWGGAYTAKTGDVVNVFSSDAYPDDATDEARLQMFADFVAGLPHGSELGSLSIYVLPPTDVSATCGPDSLACYGDASGTGVLVVPGQWSDGFPELEVITHEYGHHIAENRDNAPWRAIDWGPKRWATAMGVCLAAKEERMFPGDEADHYTLNPGEAWAEAYRTAVWGAQMTLPLVVDSSLAPTPAALAAVLPDVTTPWSGVTDSTLAGRLVGKVVRKRVHKKLVVRRLPPAPQTFFVDTPLDGTLDVSLDSAPASATLVVFDANTGVQLAVGPSLETMICGTRSVRIVVTARVGGAFELSVAHP
jgi:hypothetical protein